MTAPYLVVGGPTAVGKTAIALEAAERLGGEIVVADSRQVYRGIEIGTAKPTAEERVRVPHHLIDEVDVGCLYSAGHWARDARRAIARIRSRGGLPIVCGGTGFYLQALADGLDPIAEDADPTERAAARARVAAIPAQVRHGELVRLDPASAARLHPHDLQRVGRALEVRFLTGRPLSELQTGGGERLPHVAVRLHRPRAELRRRIAKRLEAMLGAGLEAEARDLWEAGWTPADPGLDTIGYREWWPFFEDRRSREEAVRRILVATRRYAKRQETWFRRRSEYRPVGAEDGAAGVVAVWERSLAESAR